MENATVVTLTPQENPTSVNVITFDDLNSEYSEARGKGRERRHKRRKDRAEKRHERKKEHRAMRAERKDEKLDRKLSRKAKRKAARLARRKMSDEMDMDEDTTVENSDAEPEVAEETTTSSEETGDTEADESAPEENSEEETSEEESEEEETEEPEDDSDNTLSEDESGFSGEASDGRPKINPKVKQAAMEIQRHKMRIGQLEQRKLEIAHTISAQRAPALIAKYKSMLDKIEQEIGKRKLRISQLEEAFSNFCSADGGKNYNSRLAHVNAAKRSAAAARANYEKGKFTAHKVGRLKGQLIKKGHGGEATPVDVELNPEFSEQKIVIPPKESSSNATGTGIIAIDAADDFDAPESTVYEVQSGADGSESSNKIKVAPIAVGFGLGLALIWAYGKFVK